MTSCFETAKKIISHVCSLRNELNVQIKKSDFSGPHGGDFYAEMCEEHAYAEIACCQVITASLCPIFETLFIRAISKIKPLFEKSGRAKTHLRWTSSIAEVDPWNPKVYFEEGKSPNRDNFSHGCVQLLSAIGCEANHALSIKEKDVIEALFWYRNRILHEGYEWREETLKKATNHLNQHPRWCEKRDDGEALSWFFVATITSTEDGKEVIEPWLVTLTDNLARPALDCVESVAKKLKAIEDNLKTSN